MNKTSKYEGVYRRELRSIFSRFKKDNDFLALARDLIRLGDRPRYGWQYGYISNQIEEIFYEIFPKEYVFKELLK